jgi:hypothetical protein
MPTPHHPGAKLYKPRREFRAWLIHDAWKRPLPSRRTAVRDARSWRSEATAARAGRLMASTPRKIQESVVIVCALG